MSVQVRRQIGKGCEAGPQLIYQTRQPDGLIDLGRLLLNRFFGRSRLATRNLVLLGLGRFGVANTRPGNQSRKNSVPDVHYDFDHRAYPCTRGVVIPS